MVKWLRRLFARLLEWLAQLLRRPPRRPNRGMFAVTEIPTLGGTFSSAHDINDRGVVVGAAAVAHGTSHAYSWDAGTMFDLVGFPGPNQSHAFAINGAGHIGGQSQLPPNGLYTHAYVTPPHTVIDPAHDIGTVGGDNSCTLDLSVDFISVGWADDSNGNMHAFYRMIAGPMYDLTPALLGTSSAEAIDSADNVVGWAVGAAGIVAFRWNHSGGMVSLLPPGATSSRAFGIRTSGRIVVGDADFGGGAHAVVWNAANVATDLGTLGGTTSVAYDINTANEIVGASDVPGGGRHAFITTVAGPMIDLNTLIPANSGWVLTEARALNAHGQIVGNGTFNGQRRGFLLT
ncbi:MAG TPA: hypothetical protein VMN60_14145 [Longimicrobiales bacterium]|nr:hypothetical protein [Longimicrobiales bacterium]